MNKIYYAIAAGFLSLEAAAHELTPTYPKLESAYMDGLSVVTMKMWNRRNDVEYYEISIFDKEWNPVPFATTDRLLKLGYLEHKSFDLYIRDKDKNKVEYICTTSKQLKADVKSTGVKSKICSRVK